MGHIYIHIYGRSVSGEAVYTRTRIHTHTHRGKEGKSVRNMPKENASEETSKKKNASRRAIIDDRERRVPGMEYISHNQRCI